jgi:deoxyribodipyrimidine photo-lyase
MAKFEKEEYAAYTIRPKIKKLLPDYLKPYVEDRVKIESADLEVDCPDTIISKDHIAALVAECDIDHSVRPSEHYRGGTTNGRARLKTFVDEILPEYETARNKPDRDGSSRLSSYLHFGYLSPLKSHSPSVTPERRNLQRMRISKNLSFAVSFHLTSRVTIRTMIRLYRCRRGFKKRCASTSTTNGSSIIRLSNSRTVKLMTTYGTRPQREMLVTGEMHNYVRMLWGKNVIAWSSSYEIAFETLVHLNNKYCLDGRDPNSYAGILWCFGKHDRPWMERPVFGMMRYMTSGSTGKKFDSKKYVEWTRGLLPDQ